MMSANDAAQPDQAEAADQEHPGHFGCQAQDLHLSR